MQNGGRADACIVPPFPSSLLLEAGAAPEQSGAGLPVGQLL